MARNKPRANAHLVGKIPEVAVEMNDRMARIIEEKDARRVKPDGTPVTLAELAAEYASLQEEESFEELAQKERSITYEALERRMLEELEKVKDVSGNDMWRGDGQTVSPKHVLNVHITDKIALKQWIKDTDQEHILEVPAPRLKSIVGEALNADLATGMTFAERAALKPGAPGSMQPPPGVSVSLFNTINYSSRKPKAAVMPDDDAPF